jgi:hypothetical protein
MIYYIKVSIYLSITIYIIDTYIYKLYLISYYLIHLEAKDGEIESIFRGLVDQLGVERSEMFKEITRKRHEFTRKKQEIK